ncbi:MAG: tetratricopeptide repeat protein [Bacteroidota bacterium]
MSLLPARYVQLLFIYVLFGASSLFGQGNSKVDSVLAVFHSMEDGEAKGKFIDSLIVSYHNNFDPAGVDLLWADFEWSKEHVALSTQIKNLGNKCQYFIDIYMPDSALKMCQYYLDRIDQLDDLSQKGEVLNIIGVIYTIKKEPEKSLIYFEKLRELIQSEQGSEENIKARVFLDLGRNYSSIGQFGEASVTLNQAKERFQAEDDSTGMAETLMELGILFSQIGLYDQAEEYIDQRQLYIFPPSALMEMFDQGNLGRNLIIQKRYEDALERYRRAYQLTPLQKGDPAFNMYILNGLIECFYFLEEGDSLNMYFEQLYRLNQELNQPENFQFIYRQSNFLLQSWNGNYKAAEDIMNILYRRAQQNKDGAELLMYNQFLADMYSKKKDFNKAFYYIKQYSRALDSTQRVEKSNTLLLYQTQFETQEKENTIQQQRSELQLNEAQARINRNRFAIVLVVILLLAGIGFLILFYRNKIQRAIQVERLRTKISSDLHDDIGSVLTGLAMQSELLYHTSAEGDKDKLKKISEMSRSAMSRMRDAVWAMDAEKDNWYSLIDRMREFGLESLEPTPIQFDLRIEGIDDQEAVEGNFRQHIYLIFKEAITNVIKHSDASKVLVLLKKEASGFEMLIHDNGSSVVKEYASSGQGTRNMEKRAESLGGTFLQSYEDGFMVRVKIEEG